MKGLLHKIFILVLLGSFALLPGFITRPTANEAEENYLMAGVEKVNITPSTPIRMSGYGGRDEPFKGVHDSLFVTTTVLGNGAQKAVIVTADLIGFSHDFCKGTISKISATSGIPEDYILLSANHNHGGPRNNTYGDIADPEVERYVEELQQKIVNSVKTATGKMQAAMIGMGLGTCKMNINRRAMFADGNVWLGRNPDGPCDHDVAVIRIDDMDRNPMALHVNWPCHGTVGGQENYQITGDWPGAAARYIEKSFAGKVIVPVTAGASADINPIYGPNDRFQDIEAIGMLLGEEVMRIAETIETFPVQEIRAMQASLMANGKKPLDSRAPNQKLESADKVEINLGILKIGNIVVAGVSGELMTEIGMRIKAESPLKNTVIITHCNGSSGYLCTNASYPEGGYEVMVSRTMPGTEYLISENLKKMIRSLE